MQRRLPRALAPKCFSFCLSLVDSFQFRRLLNCRQIILCTGCLSPSSCQELRRILFIISTWEIIYYTDVVVLSPLADLHSFTITPNRVHCSFSSCVCPQPLALVIVQEGNIPADGIAAENSYESRTQNDGD